MLLTLLLTSHLLVLGSLLGLCLRLRMLLGELLRVLLSELLLLLLGSGGLGRGSGLGSGGHS